MKRKIFKQLPLLCFAIITTVYIQLTFTGIFIIPLFLLIMGKFFGDIYFDISFDEDAAFMAEVIVASSIVITVYTILELSSWFFLLVAIFSFAMGFLFAITDSILEYLGYCDYDDFEEYYENYSKDENNDDNSDSDNTKN